MNTHTHIYAYIRYLQFLIYDRKACSYYIALHNENILKTLNGFWMGLLWVT